MSERDFFWLHIKKSAGISTRALLQPYYVEVDRIKKPKTFMQAKPSEYNDILNNYRVVLGEYQFRRCLFAKKFLYPDTWDDLFSFAFSRDPIDRCVSMYYYLFWKNRGFFGNAARSIKKSFKSKRVINYNTPYAFDVFLDYVQKARSSDSIYRPLGNHFTTHTAPMWGDITDEDGRVLLDEVYRLDRLIEGLNRAFERCGISKRLASESVELNKNPRRDGFTPNKNQIRKIQQIYSEDFDIYENAWNGAASA
ncbi:MAG: sulfotransferase family 2 domain-containing protein [Xanthomonadales bacterium]|nr:sulfotransferase family 2 domain-containing protein [Xanthomonadales bacterium]